MNAPGYKDYVEYINNILYKEFQENEMNLHYFMDNLGDIDLKIVLNTYIYEDIGDLRIDAKFSIPENKGDIAWEIVKSDVKFHKVIKDGMEKLVDKFNETIDIKIPMEDAIFRNGSFYLKVSINDLVNQNISLPEIYNLQIEKDKLTIEHIKDNMDIRED